MIAFLKTDLGTDVSLFPFFKTISSITFLFFQMYTAG